MNNGELYQKGDVLGGKYEIRGTLGKGGFGIVYLAYDRELEELMALKTFRDELLADAKARNAFKRESLLWVNLEEHPHILAARWVSEISGRLFVSMDFIAPDAEARVSLYDHLVSANGTVDTSQVLGWAIQFCLGMEHARAQGLQCHRDIKPSNILIAPDRTLKIADFGLAAAAAEAFDESTGHRLASVTHGGPANFSIVCSEGKIRCGTPGYMAPEVYRCEPATVRSDVYSFGLVLWQMAAGSENLPFVAAYSGDIEAYMMGVYREQIAERLPQAPEPFGPMIVRCLHRNPSDRYATFQELRQELESVWLQKTGTEFPAPQLEERSAAFWANKGGALDALGRHEEAIHCFDKALELDPEDAGAWNNKGTSLSALGRHEKAIECYARALAIAPRHALAWNNLGNARDELGRHDEAIACYDVALAVDAQDAGAWNNKGNALNALGRHEEAIQCLEKALVIDPRHACAWNNKAIALRSLGRHKNAIICYDNALAIDPQYAAAWGNKGKALEASGRYEEAIHCFNQALAIDVTDSNAWFNKGRCYAKLAKHEEAVACYDEALAIDAADAAAWYCKAASEEVLGRTVAAVRSLRRFVELVPEAESNNIASIRQMLRRLESKGI
jgi:tetratricopeptide (TPR) repeat protein